MRNYTLENYEDKLNHQVIHMDQAVCYCPEFRASHMMHDYPSRKLQLARAVYKGELPASEYTAELVYQSILSRQGERWQNFGECPEDLTDVMILSREMLLKKGVGKVCAQALKEALEANDGHILKIDQAVKEVWQKAIPVNAGSHVHLLLDDATAVYGVSGAESLGLFFENRGIAFGEAATPAFAGWEYFAYGMVEEGIAYLEKMCQEFSDKGITLVYTLSGQTTYLLCEYAKKVGITPSFKIVNLVDELKALNIKEPSYFYAGSFNTRYLVNSTVLNNLVTNEEEVSVSNCQEFLPLLHADKRVNILNIWQKPLCAEYVLFAFDEKMAADIIEDAVKDIKNSGAKQIIVFEPFSYVVLKKEMPDCDVIYYLEAL